MNSVRVLHVFKYFRPTFTGEGVFVERLAPFMRRLRPDLTHDVLVTATPRPENAPAIPGISQVHYLAKDSAGASQPALVAWLARNASHYDVVHHHTHVDRTFLGSLALKLRGRRVILSATLDDSIPGLLATYRMAFRPLVRRLFDLIDCFVAISPRLQAENWPYARGKSVLVPMGIPLPSSTAQSRASAREDLSLAPDAQVMVSVGGLCTRKDQLFLVLELAGLLKADPRRKLILVGPVVEEDYKDRLRAEIDRLDLAGQVQLTGYRAPWTFYAAADLFVFASREEGFGTVAIEAMAHGLPVVMRRLAGVNETFVEHGGTGLLFDTADEFKAQVETLLHDPPMRRRLGQAAREAAGRFDIEGVARRYLDLYAPQAGQPA